MSATQSKKVGKSGNKSPRVSKADTSLESVFTRAVLRRFTLRAGIHRSSFSVKDGEVDETTKMLHKFIQEREDELFIKVAEIVRMNQRKTIFLSDVVKGAKLLGIHIDATSAVKEKSMKGKKPKTEKRRMTGSAAASEVRRLQKSSGLLIAYKRFEDHSRAWFNAYLASYLGKDKTIHVNPSAFRVMQLYVERRVLDLLTNAAVLLLRDGNKAHKTLGARHLDTAIVVYNFNCLGIRPTSIGAWRDSD